VLHMLTQGQRAALLDQGHDPAGLRLTAPAQSPPIDETPPMMI